MSRRPRQRLSDILEAVAVAETIAARGRQRFDDDPVNRLAAEAAARDIPALGAEIRALQDKLPE